MVAEPDAPQSPAPLPANPLQVGDGLIHSLVEHAAFGIFHSTDDGRFLDANPALVNILGYESVGELLQLNIATDVWADPAARADMLPEPSGGARDVETQWKRKDGSLITVRLRGRAIGGQPIVYETFAEDVTTHRSLEARSRQAQKMEALGRLAGGIAHEFNNLLSSILGYAELLSEQIPVGDPRLDDVKEIQKAGRRAAGLTSELLAYGRKQVGPPLQVELNYVLTGLDGFVRSRSGQDGGETILVVEDDESVRELAGRVLRRFGYQVLMAADAAEAEKVFECHSDQIHLLLTDIVMPQTSGLQLASRLQALKPGLPVVYMSGFSHDAFANRGQLDPHVALINKPFTPEVLAAGVRRALDER